VNLSTGRVADGRGRWARHPSRLYRAPVPSTFEAADLVDAAGVAEVLGLANRTSVREHYSNAATSRNADLHAADWPQGSGELKKRVAPLERSTRRPSRLLTLAHLSVELLIDFPKSAGTNQQGGQVARGAEVVGTAKGYAAGGQYTKAPAKLALS